MSLVTLIVVFILIFLIIAVITMFTSLILFVPFIPSPKEVVAFMINLATLRGDEIVYDLGCGDARFLIEVKKKYPNIKPVGYELALGAWMLAQARKFIARVQFPVHLRDFHSADLSNADVIFLYLIPEVLPRLEKKLEKELKKGTRVYSHGFALPQKNPKEVVRCPLKHWHFMKAKGKEGPRVYVYEF